MDCPFPSFGTCDPSIEASRPPIPQQSVHLLRVGQSLGLGSRAWVHVIQAVWPREPASPPGTGTSWKSLAARRYGKLGFSLTLSPKTP